MNYNLLENPETAADPGSNRGPRPDAPTAGGIGPRRLRTKIFLLAALVIMAVSVFYLAYFPPRLEKHLVRDIGGIIETTTTVASAGAAAELQAGDRAGLDRILKENCKRSAGIRYAVFEDAAGLVLASANRDVAEENVYREADPVEQPLNRRAIYRTKTPVAADGKALGTLFLGFSFEELIAGTSRDKTLMIIVGLAGIFVSLVLASLFSGQITRPVVQVTRAAEKILKGDMSQRAKVYSRDEMGLLARTFNAMVDGFDKTRTELESANRALEEAARTRARDVEKEIAERRRIEKELRLAQDELEHRVEKRTAELSKVNEELSGKVIETRRSEDQLQSTLERLERALDGMVKAMSMTIEMRDVYTSGHQRRVTGLAVAIAEELHLPSEKIEGLRFAGVLHDIGKIAMPAEILSKPTRLTKTEFQLIKDHPRIGFDILKDIQFPWPVAHIVLQHHERMDGSGYPDGLIGEAILLEARILAVADVVEAISSHRPYRPALGIEKALEEVRRGRGIRYDMRVVDACLKIFRDQRYTFKKDSAGAAFL